MRLEGKGQSSRARLTEDLGFGVYNGSWGHVMKQSATAIGLMFCLSACGGGGGRSGGGVGGGGGIDPRLARLDIYEAQKLRVLGDPGAGVMGMPMTSLGNVPDSGALMFEGSASIRVEREDAPLVLFGDAGIRLDFDTSNAVGQIDRVFGANSTGTVVDFSGVIDMAGGVPGQNMDLSYHGALNASGETLGFDGTMNGVLLGNPVGAFSAADLEAWVDQNGKTQTATMVITLEQVNAP